MEQTNRREFVKKATGLVAAGSAGFAAGQVMGTDKAGEVFPRKSPSTPDPAVGGDAPLWNRVVLRFSLELAWQLERSGYPFTRSHWPKENRDRPEVGMGWDAPAFHYVEGENGPALQRYIKETAARYVDQMARHPRFSARTVPYNFEPLVTTFPVGSGWRISLAFFVWPRRMGDCERS